MFSYALPFSLAFLIIAIAAIGWLFGRWRGQRVSLSGLAICAGAILVGLPAAHLAHIDGVPLLILAPLAIGFAGPAAFKQWILSVALSSALVLAACLFGEIPLLAISCSFDSAVCV